MYCNFLGTPLNLSIASGEISFACNYFVEDFQQELWESLQIVKPQQLHNAVIKRQAEYLAGRYCAQQCLAQIGYCSTGVATGKHRSPTWPAGTVGSISHTNNIAIVVLSQKHRGIGVDIEQILSSQNAKGIESQVLRPDEMPIFQQFLRYQDAALTLIFSAKESLFKALYPSVGRYFDFECAKLLEFTHDTLLFEVTDNLSICIRQGLKLRVHYQIMAGWIVTDTQFN